jgi:hypothetical protein
MRSLEKDAFVSVNFKVNIQKVDDAEMSEKSATSSPKEIRDKERRRTRKQARKFNKKAEAKAFKLAHEQWEYHLAHQKSKQHAAQH